MIVDLILECDIDVLCLAETWLQIKDQAILRQIHELVYDMLSNPSDECGEVFFSKLVYLESN